MYRRAAIAAVLAIAGGFSSPQAQTGDVRVVESAPKAHARIGRRNSAFFVRFDRPVDHRKSTLVIKQGDKVTTGEVLGDVADRDHDELQFDVFRGTTSVDPTPYLGMK